MHQTQAINNRLGSCFDPSYALRMKYLASLPRILSSRYSQSSTGASYAQIPTNNAQEAYASNPLVRGAPHLAPIPDLKYSQVLLSPRRDCHLFGHRLWIVQLKRGCIPVEVAAPAPHCDLRIPSSSYTDGTRHCTKLYSNWA